MRLGAVLCSSVMLGPLAIAGLASADTYRITLDHGARDQSADGRVILFFITQSGGRWGQSDPIEAPFFTHPQPIASIEVKDFKPGDSVVIDSSTPAFPHSLDKLDGAVRVQALLDADQTERSHEQGPGNTFSDAASIMLSSDKKDDAISLTLTHRIDPPQPREDLQHLRWVRFRSELLSKFYGRDIHHRAGVALPRGYHDPNLPRQQWPAIYVIPGYGGRDDEAENYLEMLATNKVEEIAPIGVYIVLDPESPLGHHGFVDSPSNGPRETALVTEFIPYLESQFRLVAAPEARLIKGHSSGGWSSLWLQLNHPDIFGGCWSSSPDPIDFHAFQMTDLYDDASMFVDAGGQPTPSLRRLKNLQREMVVLMTVAQECGMECAIDPNGRSGQQWDAWEAMFSPAAPPNDAPGRPGLPRRLFDRRSGAIDKAVVEHWSKFDIARKVNENWPALGPVVLDRVRLACGSEDSFYLERAVIRFKQMVDRHQDETGASRPGYVLVVERADHDTIHGKIFQRWNKEQREHLQAHGLQDPDAKPVDD
jgi:hypothetical protein